MHCCTPCLYFVERHHAEQIIAFFTIKLHKSCPSVMNEASRDLQCTLYSQLLGNMNIHSSQTVIICIHAVLTSLSFDIFQGSTRSAWSPLHNRFILACHSDCNALLLARLTVCCL